MIWDCLRRHADQVEMFRRSIRRGRWSQAYLFVGPEGIGKRHFARLLAQCLFCERTADEALDACGACPGCRQVAAGTHPDFLTTGCPEGKREMPIDVIAGPAERRGREGLCYELSLRPMAGRRKVAVVDDVNLMNEESANAFLKTLEEPPPYATLILIATNEDGLLPTIRSRCQQVRFGPLSEADLVELLLQLEWLDDRAEAESLAALCDGSLAVAQQLLDGGLRQLRDDLYLSLSGPPQRSNTVAAAKALVEGLDQLGGDSAAQRRNAIWLVRFCIEFYRQAARRLAGGGGPPLAAVEAYVRQFGAPTPEDVEAVMEQLDRAARAESELQRNAPIPLCLEALINDLGRSTRAATARA